MINNNGSDLFYFVMQSLLLDFTSFCTVVMQTGLWNLIVTVIKMYLKNKLYLIFYNIAMSLFVLAFRLRQWKMFDASYDGLHLSIQNYTYPH